MASLSRAGMRPHAVLLTIPGQGHINAMLQLAKLLHSKGFYITFVHTQFSHQSVLDAEGPAGALQGLEDFKFEVIPDGVSLPTYRSSQKVSPWCLSSFDVSCTAPFRELLVRLNAGGGVQPQVTCVVYNRLMSFALGVAEELRIPALVFCPMNAVGFMGSFHLEELVRRGYTPLKGSEGCTGLITGPEHPLTHSEDPEIDEQVFPTVYGSALNTDDVAVEDLEVEPQEFP